MATADLLKDSKPPLTFPPNFKCKKGSVTAAAAACMPLRGGVLLMKIHKAKKAPLNGHPQGVPCAELASRRLD